MSESMKPRFSVDLNEIERQLAQTAAPHAQPASATRSDPLAELARIVGQEDPFQAILANEAAARPRQQASTIDDLFAVRDTVTPDPRTPRVPAQRSGANVPGHDFDQYAQPSTRGSEVSYGYQRAAQPQGHQAYAGEAYAQNYYEDNSGHYADDSYAQPEHLNYPRVERPRSRKGMVAIGAILGAAVLGVGGAYLFGGGSSLATDGEPPLIKAQTEPTKVQPQNPGGVEIPNQNKQIYERASQSTETKIVNREEQPVDVKQALQMNGGTDPATRQADALNLGEPRKVRTVTIRPDGSVVGAEGNNDSPAPVPVPTMTLPTEAQPAPVRNENVQTASVQQTPVQPRPVVNTPTPVVPTPAPEPVPAAATPASGSSPQQVASAQPIPVAPEAAEAAEAPVGGFSVQLGLANSESGAETAFASFQRKYAELEGLPLLVRTTEVNGNTVYRVRVGPMSKEEASSLCSKLQGQGGQCFVAKN